MRRCLVALGMLFACQLSCFGQFHRINQVLQRGTGVDAEVVPGAVITVCAPGATASSCTISPIYGNISLTAPLRSLVIADASGNYDYYVAFGCVDEIISSPKTTTRVIHNICSAGSTAGTIQIGAVTTGAAGSTASVSNVGTASAAILNIAIPQGAAGTNGVNGANGMTGAAGINGTNGVTPAFSIGTVVTGAPGSQAMVTLGGTSLAPVLNFSIPAGETGISGSGSGSFSASMPYTFTAPETFTGGILGDSSKNSAVQFSQSGSGSDLLPMYDAAAPTLTVANYALCILNAVGGCDSVVTTAGIHTYNMRITSAPPPAGGANYTGTGGAIPVSNLGVGGIYQTQSYYETVPDNGTIRTIEYAVYVAGTVSTTAATMAIFDLSTGTVIAGTSTPLVLNGGQNYAELTGLTSPIVKGHKIQVQITIPTGSTDQPILSSTGIYVN